MWFFVARVHFHCLPNQLRTDYPFYHLFTQPPSHTAFFMPPTSHSVSFTSPTETACSFTSSNHPPHSKNAQNKEKRVTCFELVT
uniref:Uncharacterized protein n=1 Tax=Octopus bimaculoides TaxID=37653 RepID=A0A0L8HUT8_OCTBM